MTLHQLDVFSLIARLGSFTKAAAELHIGQPSVSALMLQLQKELGIKLFEKIGIKVQLTEGGRRFLQRSQQIMAILKEARKEIDELKGLKKGSITIGGCGLAVACGLPYAVQRFRKEHPVIDVSLVLDRSKNLEKNLIDGGLDLAIMSWVSQQKSVTAALWRKEDIVVVAPPHHPLARKRRITMELLSKATLISNLQSGVVRALVQKSFQEAKTPFEPTLEVKAFTNPRDAVRNAVAGNLGIGFLVKRHVIGDIDSGRIKILNVAGFDLKRSLFIATHSKRQNPLVPQFVELLKSLGE